MTWSCVWHRPRTGNSGKRRIRESSFFFRHTLTKIEFRPSGASSVSVVGIPILKIALKIARSAADAEKKIMWRPNAQAGPSASTACGQAEGGQPRADS